jgi:hypothetical protein
MGRIIFSRLLYPSGHAGGLVSFAQAVERERDLLSPPIRPDILRHDGNSRTASRAVPDLLKTFIRMLLVRHCQPLYKICVRPVDSSQKGTCLVTSRPYSP